MVPKSTPATLVTVARRWPFARVRCSISVFVLEEVHLPSACPGGTVSHASDYILGEVFGSQVFGHIVHAAPQISPEVEG